MTSVETSFVVEKTATTPSSSLVHVTNQILKSPSKLLDSPLGTMKSMTANVINISPAGSPSTVRCNKAGGKTPDRKLISNFQDQVVMRDMKEDGFHKLNDSQSELRTPSSTPRKRKLYEIFSPTRSSPSKRHRPDSSVFSASPLVSSQRKNSSIKSPANIPSISENFHLCYTKSASPDSENKKLLRFLESKHLSPKETREASGSSRIDAIEAMQLAKSVSRLYVVNDKRSLSVFSHSPDLPSAEFPQAEIQRLILDPAGFLKTPMLLVGELMVVGFNENLLQETIFFGNSIANMRVRIIKPLKPKPASTHD